MNGVHRSLYFSWAVCVKEKESFVANMIKKKNLAVLLMDFEASIWKYVSGEERKGDDEGYSSSDVWESRKCIQTPCWGKVLFLLPLCIMQQEQLSVQLKTRNKNNAVFFYRQNY